MIDDQIQAEYLDILKNTKSKYFQGLKLDKILFNETAYVQIASKKRILLDCMISILGSNMNIKIKGQDSELLFLTHIYHRADHDNYWNDIKTIFKSYDEIIIDKYNTKEKLKTVRLSEAFRNGNVFSNIYNSLKGFRNKFHRLYLSTVLLEVYKFKENILTKRTLPKVIMTFFDADPFENIAMQFFNQKGGITITNQHGFPVFRSSTEDRLNQSQLLNKTATYYFAKGDFTKSQLLKAGTDEKDIIVVGNLVEGKLADLTSKGCFAVFLDTPGLPFSKVSNINMIKFAIDVSDMLGMDFIIKPHPVDINTSVYEKMIETSNGTISTPETKNDALFRQINFGLLHVSSIYIDLLMAGIKSYKIEQGYTFPLVENADDIVKNVDEFIKKYQVWIHKTDQEKIRYIASEQSHYCKKNARQNIESFVRKFT